MKVQPMPEHLNADLKCLQCGAMNIQENRVCGRCGANLPLVYDAEGKPCNILDDSRRYSTMTGESRRLRGDSVRWLGRFGVILFALFIAYWILTRR
jgi:hypothetical protein